MVTLQLKETKGTHPTDEYAIIADGQVVGLCQLRHRASKAAHMPDGFENHVYYEIDPAHRRKGYATEALAALIIHAEDLGMHQLVITANQNNRASRKVIERNGGVLVDQQAGQDGENYCKYIIAL